MTVPLAPLAPFQAVLEAGGYAIDVREVDDVGTALLAETPHALVLCHMTTWATARERVDNAQAALTQLSAEHPSPRSWDLYVVVIIEDDRDDPVREILEYDTRYARKLIASGTAGDTDAVEKALLPLLPLRGAAELARIDPVTAIRAELIDKGIERELAEAALASFQHAGKVDIP